MTTTKEQLPHVSPFSEDGSTVSQPNSSETPALKKLKEGYEQLDRPVSINGHRPLPPISRMAKSQRDAASEKDWEKFNEAQKKKQMSVYWPGNPDED